MELESTIPVCLNQLRLRYKLDATTGLYESRCEKLISFQGFRWTIAVPIGDTVWISQCFGTGNIFRYTLVIRGYQCYGTWLSTSFGGDTWWFTSFISLHAPEAEFTEQYSQHFTNILTYQPIKTWIELPHILCSNLVILPKAKHNRQWKKFCTVMLPKLPFVYHKVQLNRPQQLHHIDSQICEENMAEHIFQTIHIGSWSFYQAVPFRALLVVWNINVQDSDDALPLPHQPNSFRSYFV